MNVDQAAKLAAAKTKRAVVPRRFIVEVVNTTGWETTGEVNCANIGEAAAFRVRLRDNVYVYNGDYIVVEPDPVHQGTYRFVSFAKGGGGGNNASGAAVPWTSTPGVTSPPGQDLEIAPPAGQDLVLPDDVGWPFENALTVSTTKAYAKYTTLAAAVAAAVAGDVIWLDSETHSVTSEVIIPADVSVVGVSCEKTIISTTVAQVCIRLSNGSRIINCTIKNEQSRDVYIAAINGPSTGNTGTLQNCKVICNNTRAVGLDPAYGTYHDGTIRLINTDVSTSTGSVTGYSLAVYANSVTAIRQVEGGRLDAGTTGAFVYDAYAANAAGAIVTLQDTILVNSLWGAGASGVVRGHWRTTTGEQRAAGYSNIGATTVVHKVGHIYQGPGYEMYPNDDRLGIAARRIWPLGSTFVSHFRTGNAAGVGELAAYSWQGAPFGGVPPILDYSYASEFLMFGDDAAPWQRFYLARSITNVASSWQNKYVEARVNTGLVTHAGVRFGADDNNYAELYLDGNVYAGAWTLRFRYRDNGGAVNIVSSSVIMPNDTYIILNLLCWWTGANYYAVGHIQTEHAIANQVLGFLHLLDGNWAVGPPTVGNVGLFTDNETPAAFGNRGAFDAFHTTFT